MFAELAPWNRHRATVFVYTHGRSNRSQRLAQWLPTVWVMTTHSLDASERSCRYVTDVTQYCVSYRSVKYLLLI